MKARGALAILVCALAFLALPAGAVAKVRPAGTELIVLAQQKEDYSFAVIANDEQRVTLSVEEGFFSEVEYATRGRVSSRRVEADFGKLGKVDIRVHLDPKGAEEFGPGARCRGRDSIFVPGSYRGTIEYAGERGIPKVVFTQGPVTFTRRFKRVCDKGRRAPKRSQKKKERKPKVELGLLGASSKGDGRTTRFEVLSLGLARNPKKSFGIYEAAAYERGEGVRTHRGTFGFFGPDEFRMSKRGRQPLTLKVKPPEPFTGRATYRRGPGSPATWIGNLSVDLLGTDSIPLTGEGFDTYFCRGIDFDEIERCFYGSGSHSQPLALARLSSLR